MLFDKNIENCISTVNTTRQEHEHCIENYLLSNTRNLLSVFVILVSRQSNILLLLVAYDGSFLYFRFHSFFCAKISQFASFIKIFKISF